MTLAWIKCSVLINPRDGVDRYRADVMYVRCPTITVVDSASRFGRDIERYHQHIVLLWFCLGLLCALMSDKKGLHSDHYIDLTQHTPIKRNSHNVARLDKA